MSGESDTFGPVQDNLSGERLMRSPRAKILSGESRNITDRVERDGVESFGSSDDSRPQSWDNTSKTTSNSDVSEFAINSLLVDWKQRGVDREMHQDPDRDRYNSASDGCVQQHRAFHHGNKTAYDANGSRKSASVDLFVP